MPHASDSPHGSGTSPKSIVRKQLRERLLAMTDAERHAKSVAACSLVSSSREFEADRAGALAVWIVGIDNTTTWRAISGIGARPLGCRTARTGSATSHFQRPPAVHGSAA